MRRTHETSVLLIGDSHAADLWRGLSKSFPNADFLQATAAGCKPFLEDNGPEPCRSLMHAMLHQFVEAEHPSAVILSADWTPTDIGAVLETVRFLRAKGERVFVFGQVPEYEIILPRLLVMSAHTKGVTRTERALLPESRQTDEAFANGLSGSGATYISLYGLMCSGQSCATVDAAGRPLQFDTNHFTASGAMWMSARIRALKPDFARPEAQTVRRPEEPRSLVLE